MKRTISLLLCLCLLTVLTVSAAAAGFTPSVSQTAATADAVLTDANGNKTAVPSGELTVTREATSAESVDVSGINVANAVVGDLYEVTATGTVAEALQNGSSLTITFTLSGNANNVVAVLHKLNGVWVSEPYTVTGSNTVSVTVSSLSPFAFIYEGEQAASTGAAVSTGTTPTSPKTGGSDLSSGIVAASAAIALLAAGTVVLYKKKVA